MNGFDERTRAFEDKFARDNEIEFIVNIKACKILAKYIAEEKLALKPSSVQRYCDRVASVAVRDCSPKTMFHYIQRRLKKNAVEMNNRELEYRYGLALQQARADSS